MTGRKRFMVLVPVLLATAFLALAACNDEGKVRKLREIALEKETVPPSFNWQTPAGWQPVPETSSMRLAVYTTGPEQSAAICTIIPLAGNGGGLEANVGRWLDQLGESVADPGQALKTALSQKEAFMTAGGLPVTLIDLTFLDAGQDGLSTMAGIIGAPATTIFIKLVGERAQLLQEKDKLKTLCRSFTVTERK